MRVQRFFEIVDIRFVEFSSVELAFFVSDIFMIEETFDDPSSAEVDAWLTVAIVWLTESSWLVPEIDELFVHDRFCGPSCGGWCDCAKVTVNLSFGPSNSVALTEAVLLEQALVLQ